MNEAVFADSRVIDAAQARFSIIPTNRRFAICSVIGAAIFLSTLASVQEIENVPALADAPLSTPISRSVLTRTHVTVVPKTMEPLRLQPTPVLRSEDSVQWEKFETEFGINQTEHPHVARTLQTAEYDVDRLTFAAHESARNVSSAAQFELNNGRITRVSAVKRRSHYDPSSPSMCIPEKMSVGLDVDLSEGGTYVGVLFVVPLGN